MGFRNADSISLMEIESDEINARISVDGTVTFIDATPSISKTDIEKALAAAQEQSKLLFDIERAMNTSKEYLTKVCFPYDGYDFCCGAILTATCAGHQAQGRQLGRDR